MAFTVVLVPGKTFVPNETVELADLNLLGLPTISVTGELRAISNISPTEPEDGQILVYVAATGLYTPQAIPVSTSDTFNRIHAWSHFL